MGCSFEVGIGGRLFSTLHLNLDLGFNTRLRYVSDIEETERFSLGYHLHVKGIY